MEKTMVKCTYQNTWHLIRNQPLWPKPVLEI